MAICEFSGCKRKCWKKGSTLCVVHSTDVDGTVCSYPGCTEQAHKYGRCPAHAGMRHHPQKATGKRDPVTGCLPLPEGRRRCAWEGCHRVEDKHRGYCHPHMKIIAAQRRAKKVEFESKYAGSAVRRGDAKIHWKPATKEEVAEEPRKKAKVYSDPDPCPICKARNCMDINCYSQQVAGRVLLPDSFSVLNYVDVTL